MHNESISPEQFPFANPNRTDSSKDESQKRPLVNKPVPRTDQPHSDSRPEFEQPFGFSADQDIPEVGCDEKLEINEQLNEDVTQPPFGLTTDKEVQIDREENREKLEIRGDVNTRFDFDYPLELKDVDPATVAHHDPISLLSTPQQEFYKKLKTLNNTIKTMQLCKNIQYGNASLEPINIFSRLTPRESICARIDDKFMRMKNSQELNPDTIFDIIGYLNLLLISEGWITLDYVNDIDLSFLPQEILQEINGN